jgi:hypothetical protein
VMEDEESYNTYEEYYNRIFAWGSVEWK